MSKGGKTNIPPQPAQTSSTQNVTQTVQLPDWVNQAAQGNLALAQSLSQQPYTPYPGQIVAGLTPDQQQAMNLVRGQVGMTIPTQYFAESALANLPGETQQLTSPYLAGAENAAVSQLQRGGALAQENLAGSAVGQGAFGGTRYGVQEAEIGSETQRNIGQTVAGMEQAAWQPALAAALQMPGQMMNIGTAGQTAALQGEGALLSAGGLEQAQQQAGLTSALQQWQAAQNWPYSQLAVAESGLAGTPYGATTTAQQPYNQNAAANALGTAASALPLASSLYNAGSSLYNWLSPASMISPAITGPIASATASGLPSSLLFSAAANPASLVGAGSSALDLATLGDITASGAGSAAAAAPFLLA